MAVRCLGECLGFLQPWEILVVLVAGLFYLGPFYRFWISVACCDRKFRKRVETSHDKVDYRTTLLHCCSQMDKQSFSNTRMHSGQQKAQEDDKAKRPRQMQQGPSSSIIQLSSQLNKNIFVGDVLTRYGPVLNKNASSPAKAQVLHADLVDRDGHMTITVTMKNTVIALFKEQLSPGNSVRINGFSLVNKGTYDRGDAQHCILLHETSVVKSIPQVCSERKLVPDTTIHDLVHSNDNYVVGSIAAIVISCKQVDTQFELGLKDGDAATDTSTLILNDGFKDMRVHIQQQLTMKLPPLYIFKNVVRSGAKGSQTMRPGPSTFIDTLNDECAKTHLLFLIKSKTQVQGKLKAKNVYAPPFRSANAAASAKNPTLEARSAQPIDR